VILNGEIAPILKARLVRDWRLRRIVIQTLNQQIASAGYLGSEAAAQIALEQFINSSLNLLGGTTVSNSGFF